jgi:hypothetical protein
LRTADESSPWNSFLARLLRIYDCEIALRWLAGTNAQLGDRRPMDLLGRGRLTDVLGAIDAEEAGSFACRRVP